MHNIAGTDHHFREMMVKALDWSSAHLNMESVVSRFGPAERGLRLAQVPYTPWQLLEHMRIAQRDILEFCRDGDYTEPHWPDDYWPEEPGPPDGRAWETSILSFKSDLAELKQLVADPATDLTARIPHGTGQTYLREVLLVIDHNAYHLGQLLLLARLMGTIGSG